MSLSLDRLAAAFALGYVGLFAGLIMFTAEGPDPTFAAAPCGQKSDANAYSAPSSFFHAWRAADGSHETKTISVPASLNDWRFS